MNISITKKIPKDQFGFLFLTIIFLLNLAYVLSKGFVSDEELSDKIFLLSSLIIIELTYILISNKFIYLELKNRLDYFALYSLILLSYLIWNFETIFSYFEILFLIMFQFYLIFLLNFFIKKKEITDFSFKKKDDLFILIGLTFFLSGIFHNVTYSTYNIYISLVVISLLIILLNFFLNNINSKIDFFISILVFLILFKVFLISSNKDAFHYSWFLGPINSINADYELLRDIVSQYGYLNILFINKVSNFFQLNSNHSLILIIIIFFIFFLFLFYRKITKIVDLPKTIIILFLTFLIFGNSGYANLNSSIFIPSSSVFRFLPSILSILMLLKLINNNIFLNKIGFYFFLSISILWSFESFFFSTFSLLIFLFSLFIFNFKSKVKILSFIKEHFFIFLIFFLSILSFFLINEKNIIFFYEHAINDISLAPKKILNNKITLLLLFLIFLGYLILRDSLLIKKTFTHNILLFSLMISFSSYFLIRSVDNNVFNLLPFFIFIICSMNVVSINISLLRILSLYIMILFTIISSLHSIVDNKNKFSSYLFNSNLIVNPEFLQSDYLPNIKINNTLLNYENIPVTLITGKTIHEPNDNLNYFGYGLPILPLEQFNVLKFERKQKLLDQYFKKFNKHLVLCTYNCQFYNDNKTKDYFNKIFIGKNVEILKILDLNQDNKTEVLYLLSKKNK